MITFQSLIGTVQRINAYGLLTGVDTIEFQSLIGTVQQLYLQHFCLYYTLFFLFFNPFPSKKSVDLSFQKARKPAFLLHSFKIGEMPSKIAISALDSRISPQLANCTSKSEKSYSSRLIRFSRGGGS